VEGDPVVCIGTILILSYPVGLFVISRHPDWFPGIVVAVVGLTISLVDVGLIGAAQGGSEASVGWALFTEGSGERVGPGAPATLATIGLLVLVSLFPAIRLRPVRAWSAMALGVAFVLVMAGAVVLAAADMGIPGAETSLLPSIKVGMVVSAGLVLTPPALGMALAGLRQKTRPEPFHVDPHERGREQ
jgi:hypothetical protein